MGYVKIWIHAVWTTKNKRHYLKQSVRRDVFEHMKINAKQKGICIDHINGYVDHVHCLLSLKADQNLAAVVQLIKGESAYWINKAGLVSERFGWQKDYYAGSVSNSPLNLERVRGYISNQESHHGSQTLDDEIEEFFPEKPGMNPALKDGEDS